MAVRAFLFGKLPAHGDFVARGLDDVERREWDGRGTALLAVLREAAGEDGFDAAHVAAPPWRFVIRSASAFDAGALAPSVDGVGRRYLLALGARGLDPELAGACGLAFAEAAEGLLYESLGQGLNADAVVDRASARFSEIEASDAGASRALGSTPAVEGLWWTLGSERFAPTAVTGASAPHDLFARTVAAPAHALGSGRLL